MTDHRAKQVQDTELDILLAQAAAQDVQSLEQYRSLESRVLQQTLPPQPLSLIDAFLLWLSPQDRINWRAPLAASFALLLGVAVANVYDFGLYSAGTYDAELVSWDDELSLLSLVDLDTGANTPNATSGNLKDD
jgi:hypothetical protein